MNEKKLPYGRYNNLPHKKNLRRHLRRRATRSEQEMWFMLRDSRLGGKKFRRQHGIGPYVVDFFCAEVKLVIELDGDVHDLPGRRDRDRRRQEHLESLGLTVVRFRNEDVVAQPDSVLSRLVETIASIQAKKEK